MIALICAFALVMVLVVVGFAVYMLRFMRDWQERATKQAQQQAVHDHQLLVSTIEGVTEAIAPRARVDSGGFETDTTGFEEQGIPSDEVVPWYQQTNGEVGVDPTDEKDVWLGYLEKNTGRVASIRPGESILPGPNTSTDLPGMGNPDLSGELA